MFVLVINVIVLLLYYGEIINYFGSYLNMIVYM